MAGLITADLHLNDNPRDSYRHDFMNTLSTIAKSQKVDWVLILGDLTEEKDRHGAWLVNRMVDYMYKLTQVCPVFIMRGNHDYLETENPFYGFLKRVPHVTWINYPVHGEDITRVQPDLRDALFLPHTNDHKADWSKINLRRPQYIFAHNTFEGATSESGSVLHGIPTDVFKGRRRWSVISGDIHKPQDIGPVTYVGAPYTVDFGDDYEPRMLILDAKGLHDYECAGPQKRLIEIPNATKPATQGARTGDIVKIRVQLTQEQYQNWHKVKQNLQAWANRRGFFVHQIQPVVSKTMRLRKAKDANLHTDDNELLRKYAKVRDVDERTLKAGLSLMGD